MKEHEDNNASFGFQALPTHQPAFIAGPAHQKE
jgi:hypothetical protein